MHLGVMMSFTVREEDTGKESKSGGRLEDVEAKVAAGKPLKVSSR